MSGRECRAGTGLLPSTAVLELTYRCNHECIFCSCPWYASGFEQMPETPVSEWKGLLDALALPAGSSACRWVRAAAPRTSFSWWIRLDSRVSATTRRRGSCTGR